jgi:hypothetical protein
VCGPASCPWIVPCASCWDAASLPAVCVWQTVGRLIGRWRESTGSAAGGKAMRPSSRTLVGPDGKPMSAAEADAVSKLRVVRVGRMRYPFPFPLSFTPPPRLPWHLRGSVVCDGGPQLGGCFRGVARAGALFPLLSALFAPSAHGY